MIQRTVCWVVGEPGVGKTTLCRRFLVQLAPEGQTWKNDNPKWTGFGKDIAAAGHWRGDAFDGADTLPISQIKSAMKFWLDTPSIRIALIDGDKLSNKGAVEMAKEACARLVCFWMVGSKVAEYRRELRGTNQNETWVAGRQTKARNFANTFPGDMYELDASQRQNVPILDAILRNS